MKKEKILLSVEFPITVEFYDADVMGVAWHGNYIKYMEAARCRLLEKIGYDYNVMIKDGIAFPILTLEIKYVHSLFFGENAIIKAHLMEYINRLRIKYEIVNSKGEVVTKAETTQIAVDWNTKEVQLESPQKFIRAVEECL